MATSIETHELEIVLIGDQPVPIEEFNNVRDAVCLLKWRSKDTSQEWSATGFYANVKLKKEGRTLDFDCVMTNYDNIFLQMEDDSDVVAVFHNENAEKETFEIPLAPFRLIRSHRTEEFNYALIYIDKSEINIQQKGVKPILADSSELPAIKPNDDVYMIHHPGQMKKHYSQDNVKLVIEPFIEYLAGTLEGPPGSPVFVLKESKFLLVAMHRKNALLVSKILDGIDFEDAHRLVMLSLLTRRRAGSMSSISRRLVSAAHSSSSANVGRIRSGSRFKSSRKVFVRKHGKMRKAKRFTVEGGIMEIGDVILKAGEGCLAEDTKILMEKDYQYDDVSKSLLELGLVDVTPRVVKFSPDGLKFLKPVDLTVKFEKLASYSRRFMLHGFYNPIYDTIIWELVTNGVEENDEEGVIHAKINSFCFYMFILSTRGRLARILSHLNHSFTCRAYVLHRRVPSMGTLDISVVLLSEFLHEDQENGIEQLRDHFLEGFAKGEKGMLKRVHTRHRLEMCLQFREINKPPYPFQIDQPQLDSVGFVIDHFKGIGIKSPAIGSVKISEMQNRDENESLWILNVREENEEIKADQAQVLEHSVSPGKSHKEQSPLPDLQPLVANRTTKLTNREMDQISRAIGIDWDNLAALMDIPYSEREEIRVNYWKYPTFSSKAKRVLEIFNDSECFDRTTLVEYHKDLERHDLTMEMLPMDDKEGEEVATPKSQPEVTEVKLLKTTPLSSREMYMLSKSLVVDWDKFAALLGITAANRDDIRYSLLYISSHSKAEKVLAIFNNMEDFSRQRLAESLAEIGQNQLMEPVITGEWRRFPF